MNFLDKIQESWENGTKVIIQGENGNNISLKKGINYILDQAEESKKVLEEETIEEIGN